MTDKNTYKLPRLANIIKCQYFMAEICVSGCEKIKFSDSSGEEETQYIKVTHRPITKRVIKISSKSLVNIEFINTTTELHIKRIKFVPLLRFRARQLMLKKNRHLHFMTAKSPATHLLFQKYNSAINATLTKTPKYNSTKIPVNEYRDFGNLFLGPLLGTFFYWLGNKGLPANQKIFFLAREGYLLKRVYDELQQSNSVFCLRPPSQYLITSRALMFKLNATNESYLLQTLEHGYEGNLLNFFKTRYNFNHQELFELQMASKTLRKNLYKIIEIPRQATLIQKIFNEAASVIKKICVPKQRLYDDYLNQIGFFDNDENHVIDIGFSGTIQKQLFNRTKKTIHGHYFIATNTKTNGQQLSYSGCFAENIVSNQGVTLLDRSLFLEAILTAPVGQAQDIISDKGKAMFHYGELTAAQLSYRVIECIIEGTIEYLNNITDKDQLLTPSEALHYYDTLIKGKSHIIPQSVRKLFEVDDSISGYGTINAMEIF